MFELLIVFHIITAFLIIGLILLQHGKGAQTGAAFGSGASTTVFGSQGSGSFLSRSTALLVAMFFIINLSLAALTNRNVQHNNTFVEPQKIQKTQSQSDVPE